MFGVITCIEVKDILQAAKELSVIKRIEDAIFKSLAETGRLRVKKKSKKK